MTRKWNHPQPWELIGIWRIALAISSSKKLRTVSLSHADCSSFFPGIQLSAKILILLPIPTGHLIRFSTSSLPNRMLCQLYVEGHGRSASQKSRFRRYSPLRTLAHNVVGSPSHILWNTSFISSYYNSFLKNVVVSSTQNKHIIKIH